MKGSERLIGSLVAVAMFPPLALAAAPQEDRQAAHTAYVTGDFDRARDLLETLLSVSPDDPDLLRRLAMVHAASNNLQEAQDSIDRAIALAPTDGDIQLARANILFWRDKFSDAQKQAEQLASTRPDYPGLSDFNKSFQRSREARRVHIRSLNLGATLSDADFEFGSSQTWQVQRASTAIAWAESSVAALEVEREDREAIDTRIAARLDLPTGPHRIFAMASVTPSADFRENWSAGAGAELALGKRNTLLLDGRFAEYRSDDVTALGAALRHSFAPDFAATIRSIHLFGGGESYRLGGSLRTDYTPEGGPGLFAIVASYPDTEIDGTRQLRAVAGGARFDLTDNLVLRVSGEYESREDSYKRSAASVDLTWNFGAGR